MKKSIIKIFSLFFIICILFSLGTVNAINDSTLDLSLAEYTDEYKEWLALSEEEKQERLEPRKFEIMVGKDRTSYLKDINNILKVQELLKANVSQQYNLKDVIPENVVIRDQKTTNSCWAFATIGVLETNLALRNYKASLPTIVYDFSEKHMNYATAKRAFNDGEINEYGYNKNVSDGGNFYIATQYLANGQGAINESDLPFVNSEENIDISEIQNKEVVTTLYDTVEFPTLTAGERDQIMPSMKEHIVNYGGIYAGIHGAEILGDSYNNETGSIYCKNVILETINHAVVIIGWDDNYSKENFNENQQPTEDGAWIIKNSWGEAITEKLSVLKQAMFEAQQSYCESMGWDTADKIPDDVILEVYKSAYGEDKASIQGDELVIEIGNEGYMYISYEDCNVYKALTGIEKVTDTKDYDQVYQHDILSSNANLEVTDSNNIYLSNVFSRDASNQELLDKIGIYTTQEYTCKVFVNPNGESKAKEDLQEVQLASGETETIEPGYHTLEFAEPIKLTGDSFAVVVQVENEYVIKYASLETQVEETQWSEAIVNAEESFCTNEYGFEQNAWNDLGGMENIKGNLTIKAYTTFNTQEEPDPEPQKTLTQIYIQNGPNKTEYTEGEDFDKTGMVVIAQYSDGSTQEITNYTIIGGENLTVNTKAVTIQYTEDGVTVTTTQAITVKEQEEPENPEDPGTEEPDNPGTEDPENPDNPGTEEPENPDNPGAEKPATPVLSDFTNAESAITQAKLYFNSEDLSQASSEMTIKISGIKIGAESNTYTYYYHISGTQGDNNITDWVKAEAVKESDGTYSITLNLKSEELQNYAEITESDNLYVYIREVAEIDQQTAEQTVTLEVENQAEPECYIDGVMVGGIDDVLNYNNNSNNGNGNGNANQNKDNTVASGILPYAGGITFKILVAVFIIAFGGFAYYRYKNIDR